MEMTTPQRTAGDTPVAKPVAMPTTTMTSAMAPPTDSTFTRVNVVSQEMQEYARESKNFLATLIKLASQNSCSPETSQIVTLVQNLLDAKIEPEQFTSRLQAELKSSPQPYLLPFLKKSLPTLRQTLLNCQQSLTTSSPTTSALILAAPSSVTTAVRPRLPVSSGSTVQLNTATVNGTDLAGTRPGVQILHTHSPVVISQPLRHQDSSSYVMWRLSWAIVDEQTS